jgi:hypothetical protein
MHTRPQGRAYYRRAESPVNGVGKQGALNEADRRAKRIA